MPTAYFIRFQLMSETQFLGPNEREDLMQAKRDDILMDQPSRALGDAPKPRLCLCCKASFWSEGFGQRICARCKGRTAWRAAVPEGIGQSRRHSSGRST